MGLYKRKDSKYWFINWYDKMQGRQICLSTKMTARREAEIYYKAFLEKMKKRRFEDLFETRRDGNNTLLSEGYLLYLNYKKSIGMTYTRKTLDNYRVALMHLYNAAGDRMLSRYGKETQSLLVSYMTERGMKSNTQATQIQLLHAIFNYFQKENIIERNPFRRLGMTAKPYNHFTREEIKKILEFSDATQYKHLVRFLILSGFRISEALSLTRENFTGEGIRITGKGHKDAVIPVIDQMKQLIKEMNLKQYEKGERIFPWWNETVAIFFSRLRAATGVDVHAHDLRKYCISEMANAGVSVFFVKDYARHSKVDTTLKYYAKTERERLLKEINNKVKFGI